MGTVYQIPCATHIKASPVLQHFTTAVKASSSSSLSSRSRRDIAPENLVLPRLTASRLRHNTGAQQALNRHSQALNRHLTGTQQGPNRHSLRTHSQAVVSEVAQVRRTSGEAMVPPPPHPTYSVKDIIKTALAEDVGDAGDVTSLATISGNATTTATFLGKDAGTIAGIQVADMVFQEVDPELKVEWTVQDGDLVAKGMEFGKVSGCARSILLAERVVLNFMQRMSGIATATRAMAVAAKPARVLETRKTVPGLRLFDKWAVLIGGGKNHRIGLFDMVLIKDNHIAAAGGVAAAVLAARKYLVENGLDIPVEVEARTLEEVQEILACAGEGQGRVTRVMLDNMVVRKGPGEVDVSLLKTAVEMVGGRLETEASGNITLETVGAVGSTGVTFVSSGSLTHSVTALDISLNIDSNLALEVGKRTLRA